jgi:hypothetical protein
MARYRRHSTNTADPVVVTPGQRLPQLRNGNVNLHFASWSDFIGQAEIQEPRASYQTVYADTADVGQMGTATFAEAVTLASTGWSEAADRIQKYSATLSDRVASEIIRPEVRYGVEGLDFDIGRLMDGEPEHWVNWDEPEEGQTVSGNRIVRILYNRCASWGVRGEILEAMGSAVAALVYCLELAGYRCEITVGTALDSRSGYNHYITTVVKQSNQDLDMAFIGYAVAHAACYRRTFWSIWSQISPSDGGHGCPIDFPAETSDDYDLYLEKALYDGYDSDRWLDPAKAESWVLGQLTALGVELRHEVQPA